MLTIEELVANLNSRPVPKADQSLLKHIKSRMGDLEQIYNIIAGDSGAEEHIYRIYHHSFKAFRIQEETELILSIFNELKAAVVADMGYIKPAETDLRWIQETYTYNTTLNKDFLEIVNDGLGKKFDLRHNSNWLPATRPMAEAFFHCKFFLEQLIKFGKELTEAPNLLPSGWGLVLELFNMR